MYQARKRVLECVNWCGAGMCREDHSLLVAGSYPVGAVRLFAMLVGRNDLNHPATQHPS